MKNLPRESCKQERLVTGSDRNFHRSPVGVISNEICCISRLDAGFLHFTRVVRTMTRTSVKFITKSDHYESVWTKKGNCENKWSNRRDILKGTFGVVILLMVALWTHASATYRLVIVVYGHCEGRGPFLALVYNRMERTS